MRVTKGIEGDEYCLDQEEMLEEETDEGIVWRGY